MQHLQENEAKPIDRMHELRDHFLQVLLHLAKEQMRSIMDRFGGGILLQALPKEYQVEAFEQIT